MQNQKAAWSIVFAGIILLLDVIATSMVPYFSKQIVESAVPNHPFQPVMGISVLLLGLGALWTFEKIALHLQEIIFFPIINRCIRNIQEKVIQHIHQIPFQEYQKLSMPELISAIKRISPSARSFVKIIFLMLLPTLLKFIVIAGLASRMGWFGFIFSCSFVLSFFVLYHGLKWYVFARMQAWETTDQVTMRMNDSIYNTKLVRAFFKIEEKMIGDLLDREAELWYDTNVRLHSIYVMIGLIIGTAFTLTIFLAMNAIDKGSLTIGDFVLLKTQLLAVFMPFKNLSTDLRQLAEGMVDIKKIFQILEIQKTSTIANNMGSTNIDNLAPSIPTQSILSSDFSSTTATTIKTKGLQILNLSFGYDPNKLLFQDLKFEIKPHESMAILGKNGQGKSTLASLIAGLMHPTQGNILINGKPIQTYTAADLSKKLMFIPQDLKVFNLSLRENLCYGLSDTISDEKLKEILCFVELEPLLASLTAGLDTRLGEFGIRLSGGEKKRIALARALLMKPEILILDETLDALNVESETTIIQTLKTHTSMLLMITQRLSLLRWADHPLRLSQGKLLKIETQDDKILA